VVLKEQRVNIAIASMLLGASLVAAAATSASAQDRGPGRYTMHKTDEGFVRLDTQTGAVSLCRKDGSSWSCQDIANANDQTAKAKRDEGDQDAAAMRRETQELKDEIARLEELLGLRGPPAGKPARQHTFKLPSEKDVDQAFDYFESMLRKFQDRLKRLEREKTPAPERQL
jgi:hypothetical protein